MKTQNIIQASANVIKLVSLNRGDVFKSIDTGGYDEKIFYNVVVDLYNDGENTFIEVVQYKKNYSDIEAQTKLFKGTDDIAIFPASIEEVEEYFKRSLDSIANSIEEDKNNLQKKIVAFDKATEFVSGELSKKIQSAEFKEQTQEQYNSDKALKEAKLKELTD